MKATGMAGSDITRRGLHHLPFTTGQYSKRYALFCRQCTMTALRHVVPPRKKSQSGGGKTVSLQQWRMLDELFLSAK